MGVPSSQLPTLLMTIITLLGYEVIDQAMYTFCRFHPQKHTTHTHTHTHARTRAHTHTHTHTHTHHTHTFSSCLAGHPKKKERSKREEGKQEREVTTWRSSRRKQLSSAQNHIWEPVLHGSKLVPLHQMLQGPGTPKPQLPQTQPRTNHSRSRPDPPKHTNQSSGWTRQSLAYMHP